jgi:predicted solute-binding protein
LRTGTEYSVLATVLAGNLGPVLVSKRYVTTEELRSKRVAVGGNPTTGSVLAMMYCPGIELVEMPYDSIADSIDQEEIDAGFTRRFFITPKEVFDVSLTWEKLGVKIPDYLCP